MLQRTKPRLTTRWLLYLMIVFNFVAIGLAEVQRRALVKRVEESERNALGSVDRSIAGFEARMSRLTISLSMLSDAKLDRPQNLNDPIKRNALRAYHATILKNALADYRSDHNSFPGPLPDNSVEDLGPALVGGGYLAEIPTDPSGREYRYTTAGAQNGQRYGLKITLDNNRDCITGVGAEKSGWWGTLPPCPF
ncbi:hypothetical protein [Bradyrhizobium lablabi]|uniref:hypothetical protein n=1 Tax=Bradyrhizobium lablabi TaxID=722472 RepID=UPI00090C3C17|nr:hypothetical protein [Bradyrhizobium lablabi]SHM80668.1 hypothetical protein SAMN05444321_7673 [Bradyrhizobium lablabi]